MPTPISLNLLRERGMLLGEQNLSSFLSVLLALEDADHLSRTSSNSSSASMICAAKRWRRSKEVKWIPAVGRESHRRHRRIASRLGDLAPTKLGRAAPGFLFHGWRSDSRCQNRSGSWLIWSPNAGSNIWFELDDADLARELGLPEGTTHRNDTIDVWIDSGVSHQAVCALHPELRDPADMYLEATDQHRGWFQSSLMTSVALQQSRALQDLRHARLRRRC